jgi:hypothetical protein
MSSTDAQRWARRECDETMPVEVHDDSDDVPLLGEADPHADRGRGLVVVDMLAASWDTLMARPGKTVWFVL